MQIILSLLITMSLLTTCHKEQNDTTAQTFLPAQTQMNVPYGGDSAQKMDLYLPGGRSAEATKSIILIHGGSWNAGNKSDLNSYIDTFTARLPDYAIFNLNYRLVSHTNRFPAQEKDIKEAIRFIADSAESFGINKEKLV